MTSRQKSFRISRNSHRSYSRGSKRTSQKDKELSGKEEIDVKVFTQEELSREIHLDDDDKAVEESYDNHELAEEINKSVEDDSSLKVDIDDDDDF